MTGDCLGWKIAAVRGAFRVARRFGGRVRGLASFVLLFLLVVPGLVLGADLKVNGLPYMPVTEVAGRFGLKARWVEPQKRVRLQGNATILEFELHRREALVNGRQVALGHPAVLSANMLYIARRDYGKTLLPLLRPESFASPGKVRRIVIDAGHGGRDPGAEVRALPAEKTLALDVARRVARALQAQGYEVAMTRTDDRFIDLEERAERANRARADLFVSIHFNSAKATEVEGIETYALTPTWQPSTSRAKLDASDREAVPGNRNDAWNVLAAYSILGGALEATDAQDRGVRRARFIVLRGLECPGVLVECGFVSNSGEARKIADAGYRERLAQGIARGIVMYNNTVEKAQRR